MEKIFLLLLLAGFTRSQTDFGPRFYDYDVDGIDGNLKFRLQTEGLDENLSNGTVLGYLKATDRDDDDNTLLYYSDTEQGSLVLVEERTGKVITLEAQDYEIAGVDQTRNDKSVTFYVQDSNGNRDYATFKVKINDVNDNAPKFTSSVYKFNVSEGVPVGTKVFTLSAQDKDSVVYNSFDVSCIFAENSNEKVSCDLFEVKSVRMDDKGNQRIDIYSKVQIDFETAKFPSNVLKLQTNDSELTATVNVLYDIIDRQDTPPVFDFLPYNFDVYENTPANTALNALIAAHDGDTGSPNSVRLSLDERYLAEELRGLFTFGNSSVLPNRVSFSAPLLLLGDIDRETLTDFLPSFILNITATEILPNNALGDSSTSEAAITIRDRNDNGPVFDTSDNTYEVQVFEQDKSADPFGTLPGFSFKVTDIDGGEFNEYEVDIIRQTFPGTFSLDLNRGSGSTINFLHIDQNSYMNYEVPSYRIQVIEIEAFDVENTSFRTTATVTLSLLDFNDNEPFFDVTQVKGLVKENSPVGTSITTITATDLDSGINAEIEYSLTGSGEKKFRVNPQTGLITVAEIPDFEEIAFYTLFYTAKDKGNPSLENSINIVIEVLDINDMGPVFQLAYSTIVNESSTTLLIPITVQAIDQESGTDVTYSIVAGNPVPPAFQLGAVDGVLSMTRLVSYDETPDSRGYFELTVRATDNDPSPQSTDTKIIVRVRDENNHAPQFTSQVYRATISEIEKKDTFVVNVSATDRDLGSNGEVQYFFRSGTQGHFVIGTSDGTIRVSARANMDYNLKDKYEILVVAQDQGNPVLSSTSTVLITLTDANNKPPIFDKSVYAFQISDDSLNGTFVGAVSAADIDSTSIIQYDILQSTIQSKDQTGKDVTDSGLFDARNAFAVGLSSGRITTNSLLSREVVASVHFKIRASDVNGYDGPQTGTSSVIITILGVLDPRPYFASPWTRLKPEYKLPRPESPSTNWTLTPLYATDPVKIEPISIFEIVPGSDPAGYFKVEEKVVKVMKEIDYEAVKSLSFVVIAYNDDKTSSATATIVVEVRDLNDNAPSFPQASYTFNVSENLRHPNEIGSLYASDEDSGSYAEMVFSLSGARAEDFEVFTINARQAYLTVSQGTHLDYENLTKYNLDLKATDNPRSLLINEKQSTIVPVTIFIVDENDNKPIFRQESYNFSVVESYIAEQNVGVVIAVDEDQDNNGFVTYDIPEPLEWFNVRTAVQGDFRIGQIYTKKDLTGAAYNSPYKFYVVAKDLDRGVSQSSTVLVTISVTTGILDKKPTWDSGMPRNVSIYEHSPIGYEVARAKAYPRNGNSTVIYSFITTGDLKGDFTKFNINPTTGLITVAEDMDREKQEIYDILIKATDSLNPTYTNSRLLTVKLLDLNDNNADYSACKKVYRVPERVNISEGLDPRFVYQAVACDLDRTQNQVVYSFFFSSLCKNADTTKFSLDQNTGKVHTTEKLDREVQDQYLLCIKATSSIPATSPGRRRRRRAVDVLEIQRQTNTDTVLYLLVNVIDINDNGPKFRKDIPYTAVIYENPEPVVITVEATDIDLFPNNRVRYSIETIIYTKNSIGSKTIGAFNINPDTGIITVGYSLYKEFYGGYFEITVRADDYFGNLNLPDTIVVTVYIARSNDLVRVVMDDIAGDEVKNKVDLMVSELNSMESGIYYQVQKISYHIIAANQDPDFSRTDVCMVIINDGNVEDSVAGAKNLNTDKLRRVISKYGAMEPGPCEPASSDYPEGWTAYWWVLVAFAIFIFVVTFILIILVCCLYSNYKKYMATRRTYLETGM